MTGKRRPKGTGTIYKHKDRGTWVVQVKVPDSSGGYKRVTRSAKTQAEANKLLLELQTQAQFASNDPADNVRVFDFIKNYRDVVIPERLSLGEIRPNSAKAYINGCDFILTFIPRDLFFDDLTPDYMLKLRNHMYSSDYKRSTVKSYWQVLIRVLKRARFLGYLQNNPTDSLPPLKTDKSSKNKTVLTHLEKELLLEDVKGSTFESWYVIAVPLGARTSEVRGLVWDDIDFDGRTVKFSHQLRVVGGVPSLTPLKTGEEGDYRVAPLADWQVERLLVIREHQRELVRQGFWPHLPYDFVVRSHAGVFAYHAHIYRDLAARVRRLGLPKISPHSFRHTAASHFLADGVDINTVMKIMGWSKPDVPLSIYAQLVDSGMDAARNSVSRQ